MSNDDKKPSKRKVNLAASAARRRKPMKNRRGPKKVRKIAFENGLNQRFLTFQDAKDYMATVPYIGSKSEYKTWMRVKKYIFLPRTPEVVYKNDWVNWPDYLGVEPVYAFHNKKYMSYAEAIGIVHKVAAKYNLKTAKDWLMFYDDQYLIEDPAERELPIERLPRFPVNKYDECKNYKQWLGVSVTSKIDEVQHRQKLIEELKTDNMARYDGQPVFAITVGVDPLKPNLVKIIAEPKGLASLIMSIERLQYDIIGVFIFDQKNVNELTQTLISNGLDYGNSCYLINNMPSLMHELRGQAQEVDQSYYR